MASRDYVLLSNLGSGGTAEVFKAQTVATGDLSTLKVFHPRETHAAVTGSDGNTPQLAQSEWLNLAIREVALGQALSSPVWVETQGLFEIIASAAPSSHAGRFAHGANASDKARVFAELTPVSALALRDPVSKPEALGVGQLALVRRHVEGASLADALHGWGLAGAQLAPAACMHAVYRAAGALAELHNLNLPPTFSEGALHGDVSPHNLLVDTEGVTFVTDLGHAIPRRVAALGKDTPPAGKLAYLAPELLAGSGATVTAEIYALGIVFWEVLTMHRLFKAENDQETWARLKARRIDPPSALRAALPPALDALVLAMLAEDPSQRPQTMEQVRTAIAEIGGDAPVYLPLLPPTHRIRRASSKQSTLATSQLALGQRLTLAPTQLIERGRTGRFRALTQRGGHWPWSSAAQTRLRRTGLLALPRRTRALALAAASAALFSAGAWWLNERTAPPEAQESEAAARMSRDPTKSVPPQAPARTPNVPAAPASATNQTATDATDLGQVALEYDAATTESAPIAASARAAMSRSAKATTTERESPKKTRRTPNPRSAPRAAVQPSPSKTSPSDQDDATLVIVVVPWGRIWLDGRELGPSPQTLKVRPGTHRIAYGADAPERSRVVQTSAGETQSLVLTRDKSGNS